MPHPQSPQENLFVVLEGIFLILCLFPVSIVNSESDFNPITNCTITQETYAPNSTFDQNLKVVLSNLTIAASTSISGFHNTSFGQKNDTVYGLYLCRGDLTAEDCSSCIANITQSIVVDCPNKTESISWDQQCMLRYAKRNIFSREEESPRLSTMLAPDIFKPPNGTLVAPPTVLPTFNRTKVVSDLIYEAAFSNSPSNTKFYAVRKDNMTGGLIPDALYSLAQCTPDISQQQCHRCLTQASDILSCCPDILQAENFLPSCHFKIDVSEFFRSKDETNLPSPPPFISPGPESGLPRASAGVDGRRKGSSYLPIVISIPLTVTILLLSVFCVFMWKRNNKPSPNDKSQTITMETLQYDISTIKAATDNFSADKKLGRGGFGDVYKGKLQSGQDIAVKRLSTNSQQGIQEFKTEVLLIAKLQHKNLVRLLGFCVTEQEKLLIYEYLPYSSLDRLLLGQGEGASLVWETRYKIIDGISKGLLYLHEESRYKIVHRDLKPSNILLDKDMTPKISDFGMAKLFEEDQTQGISNRIVGTYGYMAPEYVRNGQLSVKSDIYSFGVLVLEVVSGRRIRDGFISTDEQEEGLIQCARRKWNAKEPLTFVDPTLGSEIQAEEATRCILVGVLSTQEDMDKRPTMESIVSMLTSYSDDIPQLPAGGYYMSDYVNSSGIPDQSITYSGMEDITEMTGR